MALIVAAGCAAQVWISRAALDDMVGATAHLRENYDASRSAKAIQLRIYDLEAALRDRQADQVAARETLLAGLGEARQRLRAAAVAGKDFGPAWTEIETVFGYYEQALLDWFDNRMLMGLGEYDGRAGVLTEAQARVDTALSAYSSIDAQFAVIVQSAKNFQIEPSEAGLRVFRDDYHRLVEHLKAINFHQGFGEVLSDYEAAFENFAESALDLNMRQELVSEYRRQLQALSRDLESRIETTEMAAAIAHSDEAARFGRISVLAGGIGLGLLAMAVLGLTGMRVRGDLNRSIDAIRAVAAGDLRLRLAVNRRRNDEFDHLADAVNTMADDLRSMVTHVNNANQELSRLSADLRTTVEAVAERNTRLAGRTQSLAEAGQEMARAVNDVAASTTELNGTARHTLASSQEGADVTAKAARALEEIARIVAGATEQMTALADRSANIDRVVDVINALAEQTNLLALNAAIEAARAGEAGRGFSVVAEEVRNLAERTVSATAEIAGIVEGIRSETSQMKAIMEQGERHVRDSTKLGQRAATAMESIHSQAERASAASAQIAAAVETLSSTIGEMSAKLDKSASALDQNRRATGQLVGSSREVAEKFSGLQALTGKFKTQ